MPRPTIGDRPMTVAERSRSMRLRRGLRTLALPEAAAADLAAAAAATGETRIAVVARLLAAERARIVRGGG